MIESGEHSVIPTSSFRETIAMAKSYVEARQQHGKFI